MFLVHSAPLMGPVTDVQYPVFLFSCFEDRLECPSADTALLGLSTISTLLNLFL